MMKFIVLLNLITGLASYMYGQALHETSGIVLGGLLILEAFIIVAINLPWRAAQHAQSNP